MEKMFAATFASIRTKTKAGELVRQVDQPLNLYAPSLTDLIALLRTKWWPHFDVSVIGVLPPGAPVSFLKFTCVGGAQPCIEGVEVDHYCLVQIEYREVVTLSHAMFDNEFVDVAEDAVDVLHDEQSA